MKYIVFIIAILLAVSIKLFASSGGAQHIVFGPFFTASGTLYPSIKIYKYAAGTTTAKNCWSDEGKVTAVAQPFVGDTSGIARLFCDGDYKFRIDTTADTTLYTWDNVKVTSDTATLWEGNEGTAYPSATATNRWQLFAKHDASNVFQDLGINNGASFVSILSGINEGNINWKSGTAFTGTLDHAITADKTWTLPDTSSALAGLGIAQTFTAGQRINAGLGVNTAAPGTAGDVAITGNYTSTKTCPSFINERNGNLCLDPDGLVTQIFQNATNGSVNDTQVNHASMDGAKFAIVKFYCDMSQDGTGEPATTTLYAVSLVAGDNFPTALSIVCEVSAYLAGERSRQWNTTIVPLDDNGDFEYETGTSGTVSSREVEGYIVGVID